MAREKGNCNKMAREKGNCNKMAREKGNCNKMAGYDSVRRKGKRFRLKKDKWG